MTTVWRRLIAFGFRLLYNELAWLYDPVSWTVSLGRWRAWQQTALAHLPPEGRVLEVGCGPGHLLADLATAGHRPIGLDLSPAMLRLAQRRRRQNSRPILLCRGRAESLPFTARAFGAVILTFPTPFVYDSAWIGQLTRVLAPGGRLVVVEMAWFRTKSPLALTLEWLYRVTGQRSPAPDLPELLRQAGLDACRATVEVDGTAVGLVLADKSRTTASSCPTFPVDGLPIS